MKLLKIFALCLFFLNLGCSKKSDVIPPDLADVAPEIALESPDGTMLKLSDLKGKVVVLQFWASWCPYCRQDNPALVALYKKYKDRGLEIYSVSLDTDKTKWKDGIKNDGLVWKNHVSDLKKFDSVAAKAYAIDRTPYLFLIDKEGVIRHANFKSNLEADVEKLF